MEFNHFNDFIGLFATLNLGYAGFKKFRSIIDGDILGISAKTTPKISKLESEITALRYSLLEEETDRSLEFDNFIEKRLTVILADKKNKFNLIDAERNAGTKITDGFKSMFLSTGFYCLVLLIISGYQTFWGIPVLNRLLFFSNFLFLYNLIIFIRSFDNKRKFEKIPPVLTLVIFLLWLLISFIIAFGLEVSCLQFQNTIALTILVIISPYLLHFIRLYIHRMWSKQEFKENDENCIQRLNQVKEMIRQLFFDKIK